MNSPVIDTRKEAAALQGIPLFNRRFREVYGRMGVALILLGAAYIFALGVYWLAPWNPGYTENERQKIWLGVTLMPLAGILAASYVVEFALKVAHVAFWTMIRRLKVTARSKLFGGVALAFSLPGALFSYLRGDFDLWGYLLLLMSIPFYYWSVTCAWTATDDDLRPNHFPEPPLRAVH